MPDPLRVVMLEDTEADAELNALELRRAGLAIDWRRVETRDELLAALANFRPDLVLCDFNVPGFGGLGALRLLHEQAPDVPTITVTGSLNEETAVECIKHGAWDYVLKERLMRLAPAVNRALEHARESSARRQAEEEGQRSETRFRRLIESVPDALVVTDAAGHILLLNAQAEILFGDTRDELMGRDVNTLVPGILKERPLESLSHPAIRVVLHLYARRRDGRQAPVEVSLSPVEMPEGVAVIAAIRDISERTELEAQLRQAQKMEAVGRLAGGVAHDFNNLLTVIIGRSLMLGERASLDEVSRRDAAVISGAGEHAANLTRQLLAFSRKQVLQPTLVSLNEVVAGFSGILRQITGNDVTVTLPAAGALGRVYADRTQVEQILMNLVVNARDAMPGGGHLTIETGNVEVTADFCRTHPGARPGPHVQLSVRDTGIGMTAETQAKIFEPFFTTKGEQGTGLGLATVYGIVKQHDGYIGVESAPGEGTQFTVYLPRVEEPPAAARPASADPRRAEVPGGTETLLVVEDEEPVRRLLAQMLEHLGYRVLLAAHGEEALAVATAHAGHIDLLVTDVIMPQMKGPELAQRLAARQPGLTVLYLSGHPSDALARLGVPLSEVNILLKPFRPATLARKVRQLLDGRAHHNTRGRTVVPVHAPRGLPGPVSGPPRIET
jgi:PAS domain S-box-containing protein